MEVSALKVSAPKGGGGLSAELTRPGDADRLLVLAHGAGADFRHANMLGISEALAHQGVASLRFNFPFMEEGRRRVDSQATSVACILAALETALEAAPDLPLFLGGHSYGGRMASHAMLEDPAPPVSGLVFCSFPLHPPKKPGTERAAHLPEIDLPMLFLSGTRDGLATPELLEEVVAGLSRAELHWLDTADHGYKILKRTRQSTEDVFDELARVAAGFMHKTV
ncbi:MAG: alpha/beta fold hydrolase [Gammaproteobacteria bacterium]|nr:MAG: alpha/beta fold hydrolase [Gammaproteobacteria bacterium]